MEVNFNALHAKEAHIAKLTITGTTEQFLVVSMSGPGVYDRTFGSDIAQHLMDGQAVRVSSPVFSVTNAHDNGTFEGPFTLRPP